MNQNLGGDQPAENGAPQAPIMPDTGGLTVHAAPETMGAAATVFAQHPAGARAVQNGETRQNANLTPQVGPTGQTSAAVASGAVAPAQNVVSPTPGPQNPSQPVRMPDLSGNDTK
jgi:hypothetical protein